MRSRFLTAFYFLEIQIYNENMNKNIQKYYIDIIVYLERHRIPRPLYVFWDGERYKVDRIISVKKTFSKAGGCGLRYDCLINGHRRALFLEREGKWFIESDIPDYNRVYEDYAE